ncbi:MAG: DNA translocase FtsK 4TM domain-containing protein [Flavobacteriales bacterium]|nr:DNA translocase FtsK 4TM domain-containing protein [Flavobacteriales bacterium]
MRETAEEETEEVTPKSKRAPRRKPAQDSWGARVRGLLADDRFHKVLGLGLVLASIFLLVAFTSFLFTWRTDQDLMMRSWGEILSKQTRAENWLGKFGAVLAHRFMHVWFGLGAFTVVCWTFLTGVRILLGTWLLPVQRTLAWSAMAMIWLPSVLAFISHGHSELQWLGGGIGFLVDQHLRGLVGGFGAAALILFAAGGFVVTTFNPSFAGLATLFERKAVEEPAAEPEVDADGFTHVSGGVRARDRETQVVDVPGPTAVTLDLETDLAVTEQVPGSEEEEETAEEEEVEDESPELELETSGMDITPPLAELGTDLNGMSVVSAPVEKLLTEDQIEEKLREFGEYDPKLDLSSYELPPLDLLVDHGTGEVTVTKEELEMNKDRIVETLGHYNIGIDKIKATIGPTVTLYEIIPQAGVRISKIKNLEDDIALSLAALGIRIIAPIPGKGTIGIEVPNSKPQVVGMRAVVASEKFQHSTADLPIVLGKTISNETFVTDLAKMPHLLMAGATGQGKSVGLNAILVSLLYKKHPSQIKFVLVDPKKVELTLFNKIERHFLAKLPGDSDAIITDTKKVVATLNSLCIEMDERYELLKDAQVRNIKEYNAKFIQRRLNPENGHRYLPYIVLVVDEFADLIMTAGREVETPIARLAQLARAIGIHLIIATQRPSVNIITGTIKANFPARIAFRVTSKIDSRTILDSGGAEQLIGRGDMLLSTGNDLIRIQCAFVDTPEVDEITAFIGGQRGYPEALILPDVPTEEGEGGSDLDDGERDSMFEEAARLVVQTQQGSTSLIQRKLKLGYNRAGRIVDQLESAGILGPFEGSKARRVMIANEAALHAHLNSGVPAGPGMGGF